MADQENDLALEALKAKEKVKSLGKLEQNNGRIEVDEKVKIVVGSHLISMDELAYGGKFYDDGVQLKYRAADGKEIRHFSMVDEKDHIAIDDAMKQLINATCSIFNGKGAKLAYGNIQAADRFILALKVREATYPNPESKLTYEAHCECGQAFSIELATDKMVLNEFNEHQEKYYDPTEKCFVVPTKSYGTIHAVPATIYREQLFRDYVIEQNKKGQKYDSLFGELFWLFLTPQNQHDKNAVDNAYHHYRSLDKDELAFYVELNNRLALKPVTQVMDICPDSSCSKEVYKDITFPNGIKHLFINTASAASEFL